MDDQLEIIDQTQGVPTTDIIVIILQPYISLFTFHYNKRIRKFLMMKNLLLYLVCMYVCIHICMYAYIHICMYVFHFCIVYRYLYSASHGISQTAGPSST